MVLSVNLELLNPLNQIKWGVCEIYLHEPSFFLLTALMVRSKLLHSLDRSLTFFLLTAPDGSEKWNSARTGFDAEYCISPELSCK